MFKQVIITAVMLFIIAYIIGTLISIIKTLIDRKRAAAENKSDEIQTDGTTTTNVITDESQKKGGKT